MFLDVLTIHTFQIHRHFSLRQKYAEVTKVLIPPKLKHVFNANLISISLQRDQYGRRIIIALSGSK